MWNPEICQDAPFWGQDDLVLSELDFKVIMNKKKNCDLTGEKDQLPTYLLQSISIAIQLGNAASVLGTVYNDRKLEEIYNL